MESGEDRCMEGAGGGLSTSLPQKSSGEEGHGVGNDCCRRDRRPRKSFLHVYCGLYVHLEHRHYNKHHKRCTSGTSSSCSCVPLDVRIAKSF